MADASIEEKPLSGYRVLDFSVMLAGPSSVRLLADLGAEVIKVEPPGGDHMRPRGIIVNGYGCAFNHMNVGKKSICLDLKNPKSADVIKDLIKDIDLVVENFTPGVTKRLGIDYDTLSAIKPDLVYCSITGFGQTGPYSNRPAYGPVLHAMTGFDYSQSYDPQGEGKPTVGGVLVADYGGGMGAFAAMQTALLRRERTGKGTHIDYALQDYIFQLLVSHIQDAQFPNPNPTFSYPPLKTKDGYVTIQPVTEKHWQGLIEASGRTDWTEDERFATVLARSQNWTALQDALPDWTQTLTTQEVEEKLGPKGCPVARYFTVAEALNDPHVAHRGSMAKIEDGETPYVINKLFFQMSGCDTNPGQHVPRLGEHNDEVLKNIAGYDDAKLSELKEQNLIAND